MKKIITLSLALTIFFVVLSPVARAANGTIVPEYNYAWGENLGWLNFFTTNGEVVVSDSDLTGYVWSENKGWINLAPSNVGVSNTCAGVLSGYAWGENLGWINFDGVIINSDGKFTGMAGIEGSDVGRINFDCANCDVRTTWRYCNISPPPPPLPNTPVAPTVETPSVISSSEIQWNFFDNASDELGFKLYDANYSEMKAVSTPNLSYINETGLAPNTAYRRNIVAYNGNGNSNLALTDLAYTLAAIPEISSINAASDTAVDLILNNNENPVSTKYAVFETTTKQWLQSGNVLGPTKTYKTRIDWGGSTQIQVGGLVNGQIYKFRIMAQNENGIETELSAEIIGIPQIITGTNLVLSKIVGINLSSQLTTAVLLGTPVSAGGLAGEFVKVLPFFSSLADGYLVGVLFLFGLFVVLLIANIAEKKLLFRIKKMKHLARMLLDWGGNYADQIYGLLHGKHEERFGEKYLKHHIYYKYSAMTAVLIGVGALVKLVLIAIMFAIISGNVGVFAFENQSGTPVHVGDQLTYRVDYISNGKMDVRELYIDDMIPAQASYVSGFLILNGVVQTEADDSDYCHKNGAQITCDGLTARSGTSGYLSFRTLVAGVIGNTLINTASAKHDTVSASLFSNSVSNIIAEPLIPQCSDSLDNDVDSSIDYPSDIGCTSAADDTENSEITIGPGETRDVVLSPSWNFYRMAVTSKARFTHNGATHAVELTSSTLSAKKAGLRITSDPVDVMLDEAQTVEVDSNGNSLADLDVMIQTIESDTISVVGIQEKEEVPILLVCGDNVCNGAETCSTCEGDCGVCVVPPVCGDKICNGAETCSTCTADCGVCVVPPVCGDNKCNGTETCNTCAGDCGVCLPAAFCGDAQCNAGETCNSCSQDCGVCVVVESPVGGGSAKACSDNVDNDGDGKIDMDDSGCVNLTDDDEIDVVLTEEELAEQDMALAETKINNKLETETSTQIINSISAIISGLTRQDFEEVKAEVKKGITKSLVYTIDNPGVEKVNDIAQEPMTIAATAASIASVATVGATGFAGVSILAYLQFLLTGPLMLLRKRKRFAWGTVYDAITKKPIELAVVRLFEVKIDSAGAETNRLMMTRVTDRQGRYQFIVKSGKYFMDIKKNEYQFPSVLLDKANQDSKFENIYYSGYIEVVEDGVINRPIALDPNKQVRSNKLILRLNKLRRLQSVLVVAGPLVALISFIIQPQLWIAVLIIFQVAAYLLFRRLGKKNKLDAFGKIIDSGNKNDIKQAVVRVFDTKYNKLLDTQVTGGKGQYAFLVGQGLYYVTSDKEGYAQEKIDKAITEEKDAHIVDNIEMKKK